MKTYSGNPKQAYTGKNKGRKRRTRQKVKTRRAEAHSQRQSDKLVIEDCRVKPICEVCSRQLEDINEVEPACVDCGFDGVCSDCMSQHNETHLEEQT